MKKFISAIGAISAASVIAPMAAMAGPQGQFSDVQPTNWAYQAILNLRDRYGCAVGFPDGTFRAGEPATRAQLAALTNACLDEITTYVDAKDAALASALRAEVGAVSNRVTKLEVAAAEKAQGVGNYLGAGVLLNKQGVEGGGYTENRTVSGGTIQARYAVKTFSNENAVSIRPYANFVAGPNSEFGAGGGGLVSYDFSVAKKAGVSAANIYAGVGYQVPFVNETQANFQSAVGDKGQVVFALGLEGRLTNSLVGFADLKFPTTNAGNSYGGTDAAYSPVFTTGLGFKF
jgi:hypothetical protein